MRTLSLLLVFGSVLLGGVCICLGLIYSPLWFLLLIWAIPTSTVGLWDIMQKHHSILRNYPLLGHLRFFFESIRPEMMQYLPILTTTDARSNQSFICLFYLWYS